MICVNWLIRLYDMNFKSVFNMKTFLKIHGKVIGVLGLVSLLVACSSVGQTQITQPKTGKIRPNTTVILSVNPPKYASDQEEVTDVIRRLKSQLFGRLMSEGIFKQVFHPGESADYRMDVQLICSLLMETQINY